MSEAEQSVVLDEAACLAYRVHGMQSVDEVDEADQDLGGVVYADRFVTLQVARQCEYCAGPALPGQRARYVYGRFCGDLFSNYFCGDCCVAMTRPQSDHALEARFQIHA